MSNVSYVALRSIPTTLYLFGQGRAGGRGGVSLRVEASDVGTSMLNEEGPRTTSAEANAVGVIMVSAEEKRMDTSPSMRLDVRVFICIALLLLINNNHQRFFENHELMVPRKLGAGAAFGLDFGAGLDLVAAPVEAV